MALTSFRDAPWWNPANPQDGKPVVRHAPDDIHYHYADARQLERVASGRGVTVTVPRARDDGRSMGFDPSVPGVVHVDPDAPDGGAVVDLAHLTKQQVNDAFNAANYPHEVFYQLGVSPAGLPLAQRQPPQPRPDYNPTTSHVVPGADDAGRTVWNPPAGPFGTYQMAYAVKEANVQPAPPLPGMNQGPPAVAVPSTNGPAPYQGVPPPAALPPQQPYYPAQPQPAPYYPPPAFDPNAQMQSLLGQLVQSVQALQGRITNMENRPPAAAAAPPPAPSTQTLPAGRRHQPPRPAKRRDDPYSEHDPNRQKPVFGEEDLQPIPRRPARRRDEDDGPRQRLSDLEDEDEDPRDGIIVGFDSLRLAYVTGPLPLRPRRRVFFEFSGRGKQAAWYHDVLVSRNCVTLVYDTRYEEGQQYEPPDMSEETDDADARKQQISLHVPHLKKTFTVGSVGLSYAHGCFDHVVLPLIQAPEDLDYEEDK